jgi:hypothetical protein
VARGTPGLTVGADEDKMGLRSSGTVALFFDGCRVPADNLVGTPGGGYGIALGALGAGRIGIAAQCLGIAEAAMVEGLSYVAERRAFGKRVADFQNTQFALADCRLDLDAAWLLTLRAARLLDAGERTRMESSMAKLAASEAAGRVVDRILQLHGGNGYSREYPIERLYRDMRGSAATSASIARPRPQPKPHPIPIPYSHPHSLSLSLSSFPIPYYLFPIPLPEGVAKWDGDGEWGWGMGNEDKDRNREWGWGWGWGWDGAPAHTSAGCHNITTATLGLFVKACPLRACLTANPRA